VLGEVRDHGSDRLPAARTSSRSTTEALDAPAPRQRLERRHFDIVEAHPVDVRARLARRHVHLAAGLHHPVVEVVREPELFFPGPPPRCRQLA